MNTTLSPEFNRTIQSADEGAIARATEIDPPGLCLQHLHGKWDQGRTGPLA